MAFASKIVALFQLAKQKPDSAHTALFEAFRGQVYATAYSMTRNREDALDCVQETMLRFYQNLDQLDPHGAITAWLRKVTVRVSLDLLEKRNRELGSELDPECLAETPTPETLAILDVLKTLTHRERAAFLLVYQWGYSTAEAGTCLAISPGTVKTLCFRARQKLRERWGGTYGP
ncbi:MAG: sigma-70 family RNA polymerase sigma factor [Acidobacteria bacterium]|nr:sigma-70 family RNA polymerase sigma factor [Acidobacteriota bacterium]